MGCSHFDYLFSGDRVCPAEKLGRVMLPVLIRSTSSIELVQREIRGLKVMSRHRFEKLQSYLRFSNNNNYDSFDRLHKISPLIKQLNTENEEVYKDGKNVCVD